MTTSVTTEPTENTPPNKPNIFEILISPQTDEHEFVVRLTALAIPAGIGVAIAAGAELSRMVINGWILNDLTGFFHTLVQQQKMFFDFVYSGPDFAMVFAGPLITAFVLESQSAIAIAQFHESFTRYKKKLTDPKSIELVDKIETAFAITVRGIEFTATSLLGAYIALFFIMDELLQFQGKSALNIKNISPQMEDLYSYVYGFTLAMAIYTALKIRAYILYYGAKDKNDDES